MWQRTFTLSEDDRSAGSVGGASAPVSSLPKPPLGSVIQIRAYRRPIGSEEASSPDDDVPVSIGELAVRIVGRFKLPKVKVLAQGKGGVSPAPDAHRPGGED
jgi:hypothetical protein